jgi:tetratricopeptide (TPR) repeat protein
MNSVGTSAESEKGTPYYALRGIVRDIVKLLECATLGDDGALRVGKVHSRPPKGQSLTKIASLMMHNLSHGRGTPSTSQDVSESTRLRANCAVLPLSEEPMKLETISRKSSKGQVYRATSEAGTEFEAALRRSFSKVKDIPTGVAHLISLILPEEFRTETNMESGGSKFAGVANMAKLQELVTVLSHAINALSQMNRVMIILPDVHFMDRVSWKVVQLLLESCPRALFVLLSQPAKHSSGSEVKYYDGIRKFATSITLTGLSQSETAELIIYIWNSRVSEGNSTDTSPSRKISSVDPAIFSKISSISGGNPLYAIMLLLSLKEKKLYDITEDGMLMLTSTANFNRIVPGSDLHSIIVSQYDRLDPIFQGFLKVTSVLGQTFLLRDVFQFLEWDQSHGNNKISARDTDVLVEDIDKLDKYGFLSLNPDEESNGEAMISFKNSIIRESIYSTMLISQRQALHLSFAEFYETKLLAADGIKDSQLILKVFEHYQKCDGRFEKKVLYLEQICHLYFESSSYHEAIKYYQDLLSIATSTDKQSSNGELAASLGRQFSLYEQSRWFKELGEAYLATRQGAQAESCLRKALTYLGYQLPVGPFALEVSSFFECLKIRKPYQISSEISSPIGKGSIQSNVKSKASAEVEQIQRIRDVLMSLSELFMWSNQWKLWRYVVWSGYNMGKASSYPSLSAAFLALSGYALLTTKNNPKKAAECMNWAQGILAALPTVNSFYDLKDVPEDESINLPISQISSIVDVGITYTCHAALHLFQGNLTKARALSSTVVRMGDEASNVYMVVRAQRTMLFVEFLDGVHNECKTHANDLWMKCKDKSWEGRVWSLAFIFLLDIGIKSMIDHAQNAAFFPFALDMKRRFCHLCEEEAVMASGGTGMQHTSVGSGIIIIRLWIMIECEYWRRTTGGASGTTGLEGPFQLQEAIIHVAQLIRSLSRLHFDAIIGIIGILNLVCSAFECDSLDSLAAPGILIQLIKSCIHVLKTAFGNIPWCRWIKLLADGLYLILQKKKSLCLILWEKEVSRTILGGNIAPGNPHGAWIIKLVAAKLSKYSDGKKMKKLPQLNGGAAALSLNRKSREPF